MKIDLKLLGIVAGLGSLFYFLNHKAKETPQQIEYITITIDEKSSELPTTKPLYFSPAQNYLEVGNNINSKR